ncbi:cytochrome P450 [Aspergillus affinis]|uniref:cytochrome P450 n=1 Tax=Aspergillus affinis TaxID=1070780 RepID=UPI0022FEC930|nr:cytochrome P450 [Aspergillus affinis]KAI9039231.1 cytochrome P450 [Aspergillus affinis]
MPSLLLAPFYLDFSPPIPFILLGLALTFFVYTFLVTPHSSQTSSAALFTPDKTDAGNRKKRWLYDSVNLLQEGYQKFYGKPFRIWTTEGEQVVIPPDYVDELKMLPDHTFPSALRHFFLHKYLWPIEVSKLDYGHVVMKNDLNKSMGRIFPEMRDEVNTVFPLEFPESKDTVDWYSIPVYPKILRLVSRVNGRIFYTKNIFLSSAKLRFFHPWLRPLVQFFIPELRTVWNCNSKAQELLSPILRERQNNENKEDYKKPNDSIEWLRDLVPEPDRNDPLFHAISQLGIGAVSVNTTTQLLTNSLLNLATYPEYMSILQEEIDSVRSENGGQFTLENMGKLKKLDSFVKETLRFNGHLTATFQRKTLRPITLSDGTSIAPGTFTLAPANAVNFDDAIYPDANTFNGLRFFNLRQSSVDEENKHQLTSITKTQLQFGSGRHACPGRWFASYQIKLVLAKVIDNFELKLKGGQRPKGLLFQTNQLPDPKAEILFRAKERA